MKGLFVKDLMLLKNQKRLFVIILFFAVLYPAMGMTAFSFYMMGIMGLIAAVSTLSYDEFDHGESFLFTLPFTRKEYVVEKYLLCIGGILFGSLLGFIAYLAVGLCMGNSLLTEDIILFCVSGILGFGVALPAMLPVYIRFGVERGRIPAYVTMFLVLALSGKMIDIIKDRFPDLTDTSTPSMAAALFCFFVLDVVLICISIALSMRLIEKKEY